MIRFIIKCGLFAIFVLVIISLFAPNSSPTTNDPATAQTDGTTTIDAILAVKNTIGDVSSFCDRNEKTCETGRSFIGTLGVRMRDGAKIAYEYLDSKFGSGDEELSKASSIKPNKAEQKSSSATDSQTSSKSPTNAH